MNPLQSSQLHSESATALPSPAVAAPIVVHARLEHIFISPGHDYWVKRPEGVEPHGSQNVAEVLVVAGKGLEGDRYFHGRANKAGQVTFLAAEMIDALRNHFGLAEIDPSLFRRNLIVRGMDLRALSRSRFVFQGVEFEGAQECKPCVWMDRVIVDGAQAFMRSPYFGGLRARICTPGILRVDNNAI